MGNLESKNIEVVYKFNLKRVEEKGIVDQDENFLTYDTVILATGAEAHEIDLK